jgi:uncharacterized protein (DUF302 family)
MVSARGGKHGFVFRNRHDVYRALRRQGKTKEDAAQIANAGHTKTGRTTMAKKAAATRAKLSKPFPSRRS